MAVQYLVGHRGEPRMFPGNTMKSFQWAARAKCNMVECDIRLTADNVVALAHDPYVTDVNGARYVIDQSDFAVLNRIDLGAGEGVPSLEELVNWSDGKIGIMADMKCEGETVEREVARLLLPVPLKVVPGAGTASRSRLRSIAPTLPLSLTLNMESGADTLLGPYADEFIASIDTEAVTWQYPLLTPANISSLKARGLTIYAWTVDDMEIARRLADAGVDGIISNLAHQLVDALGRTPL